jgi:hypothetical protein
VQLLTLAAVAVWSLRGWFFAGLLLLISMVTQFAGSAMILRPAHYKPSRVKLGCYVLLGFVFVQPFMYGQARDLVCSYLLWAHPSPSWRQVHAC